jgi:hypothetical protein
LAQYSKLPFGAAGLSGQENGGAKPLPNNLYGRVNRMLNYAQLTCVLALSAAALSAQTQTPAPTVETTAMVGLADAQTAQLNLLNPGVLPPALGMICTAEVTFIDADGTSLKSGVVTVLPGRSGSLSLRTDSDVAIAVGDRREIRAVITIPAPATTTTPAAAPCTLIHTLEIYDTSSGRTLVSLGHTTPVPSVVK